VNPSQVEEVTSSRSAVVEETRIYRTFPPEVVSNSHDFDVRWVVHNNLRMRGVFARRVIPTPECSLYMGAYPGHRITKEASTRKVDRYANEHKVARPAAARQVVGYSLSLREHDPGHVLDPTDEEGNLLPEFIPYLVLYINEPPPGAPSKAAFVYNQPRGRYEVWLLKPVHQDEEIYLYYGRNYVRDYPINLDAANGKFSHFIPEGSIFRPDLRGIPAPLQVPQVGEF
jgi:hypothetical protein